MYGAVVRCPHGVVGQGCRCMVEQGEAHVGVSHRHAVQEWGKGCGHMVQKGTGDGGGGMGYVPWGFCGLAWCSPQHMQPSSHLEIGQPCFRNLSNHCF